MPMRIVLKFKPLLLSPFFKSNPPPPFRIADVLLLQDHEEDRLLHADGCTGSSNCSKPRRIADRLFFCFTRGKLTNKFHGDQKKGDDDVAPPDHVADGPDLSPEICGCESKFNVGIGCCLLHLIAESKNELQKMTELRIQMESVLQTVKERLLNKDLLVHKNIESNEGDGVEESLGFNSNLISNRVLFDQSLKSEDAPKEDCLEGMDRLEAELEVELERLQLLLDSGKFPTNPPQETIEECKSCSLSHGEVIDDAEEEGCPDSHCGVPPYELEMKLHELLETRQEQQIKDLEDALESAKKELREKEREISWWKDTAHLMLDHAKQSSPLNFQYVRHVQRLR
ncbi:protein POLAR LOCALIZATION DURING ASYMMETRIC DIVISION AND REDISTRIBUTION-like isoform X2 [Hibiscus syriacus]|uniref:protein POLAR LOCALIZATION DURING ASYMMETRIC DIVISION AND REDISTRIBUTION-like isoform X2 n=1 Tax=Hibiscus syriacus TaxID=106335 RepID=UPI001924B627|nr:protein POLAR LOCALIZATION DURING ASYMMETRIC DIVISION AND REDISTRIBUTION-like isoform X2 [Hibiscus syriacus]